jgi:hypothetical protein
MINKNFDTFINNEIFFKFPITLKEWWKKFLKKINFLMKLYFIIKSFERLI